MVLSDDADDDDDDDDDGFSSLFILNVIYSPTTEAAGRLSMCVETTRNNKLVLGCKEQF